MDFNNKNANILDYVGRKVMKRILGSVKGGNLWRICMSFELH